MIPADLGGVLLRRTTLQQDESLFSLLTRLARLNGYDPPNVLLDPLRRPSERHGITMERLGWPQLMTTMRRLAELTEITVDDLIAATGHRFADTLMPPQSAQQSWHCADGTAVTRIDRRVAGRHLLGERVVQFCPRCLAEAPYHRVLWMPYATAACLRHHCLLCTTCPSCSASVRMDDLVDAHCQRCQMALADLDVVSLVHDAEGLLCQRILQTWLIDGRNPRDLAHQLPDAPANVLYCIMDALRIVTLQHAPAWKYLHPLPDGTVWPSQQRGTHLRRLSAAQRYAVYTTAVRGLLEWPTGFTRFLNAYQTRNGGRVGGGLHTDLGTLHARWLERAWQHPAFQCVQDAFEQHAFETPRLARTAAYARRWRRTPQSVQRFSYITISEAARLLHTTTDSVHRLIETRRLTGIQAPHNQRFMLLRRADVVTLAQRWSQLITLSEAAALLGLSEAIVTDLYGCGALAAEQTPAEGFPRWMFARETLTSWRRHVVQALDQAARPKPSSNHVLNLVTVTRMLTAIGEIAATVLQAVVEGRVRAALTDAESPLSDLQFTRTDVRAYIALIKQERGWMGRAEVRQLLKIKDTTLAEWVRAGRLTPVLVRGTVQWFGREQVHRCMTTWISTAEAATLIGVRPLTVQTWVRQGRLPARSGPGIDDRRLYLFDRDQLQAWRTARLTVRETTVLLGISRATLHRWVEVGRLQPLADMGGTQRWFARAEVMLLAEGGLCGRSIGGTE